MSTRSHHVRRCAAAGCAAALLVAVGCGDDDDDDGAGDATATTATTAAAPEPVIDPGDHGDYRPALDASAVVDRIDNPYLPYLPGAHWRYTGVSDEGEEFIEVTVLDERRQVMGIDAVVVHDTVSVGGVVVEDTYDWYAQDVDGNVWYLGEETAEYEDGQVVSTEGSWEAGVDGALPGVVMWADPQPGQAYRQEYYPGHAEDLAQVVDTGTSVSLPEGRYDDVLVVREWNPLEPDVVEEKSYAPGVGPVLEDKTVGGEDRVTLVSFEPGRVE